MKNISDSGELNIKDDVVPLDEGPILDELPILPVRDLVIYPLLRVPLAIAAQSVDLINEALSGNKLIGLTSIKHDGVEDPKKDQVFEIGTVATVVHAKKLKDGTMMVILNGLNRFRVTTWLSESPFLRAKVLKAPEVIESDMEMDALQRHVRTMARDLITMSPQIPDEIAEVLTQLKDPLQLAYAIAFNSDLDLQKRQEILELDSSKEKLKLLSMHLAREKEVLAIGNRIQTEVKENIDKTQREYYLRQQMKAIKNELGESDEDSSEHGTYAARIEDSDLTEEARQQAVRELERLSQMSPQSAEHPLIKTYLDWLLDLPWNLASEDSSDISSARSILDSDHYGLDEVKERLIEYLAVRSLVKERGYSDERGTADSAMGVILCLAGPPGVGKTSLGRSVARALGRKFTRMSLGGMRDEAEIRGHRRTYIGAMPGRIIQAVKRAGTKNPVFMLDEIDKVGQDWRGDPSSALLEVLDPAQNGTFRDHYLDVDFDLSQVIFIATANQLGTIPPPLRDRMEIIQLDGYTEFEKVQIAKRHLIQRQLKAHGLREDEVTFMDDAVRKIVRGYTREAGVRNLERQIAAICRKGIVNLTDNGWSHVVITPDLVLEYLKNERFESERAEVIDVPGVANGLAVTPVGGEILTIEATRMSGKGRLTLTGQLGDVMKESARIALSYVRSQAKELQIDPNVFENADIHLHVPAGALPKDGPSAGIAMMSAFTSLFSNRAIKSDVGITGEVTLRGRILPVGGIKSKVLAAHRAGLTTVILPKKNERDLDDLPDEVLKSMAFIAVERAEEALKAAFEPELVEHLNMPVKSADPHHVDALPVHANCSGK
ncbi:MAG: endopeptidase La [Desulfobacterales bacterium]|jgi:ATP-dependent Lon protease